ncbi:RecQ family ATP-dependent DNA helicase [Candidatus Uhrbacteria bacterium]|nr:RecQ family ATP-dependent DNA helicase [Candidatus Uhrbacteria bacterium]
MLDLLKKHFGYDAFRPLQQEIVEHCVSGKDALVLMPTGGGKSLCFQLPALTFDGLTVVISPLIALMKDQVDALKANGIAAAFLNSMLSPSDVARVEALARSGKLKLLYLAPERLAIPGVRQFLQTLRISLFAVDEAHCISEWGHDFRPDYRNLDLLRTQFPGVPVMALTATANMRVRDDIVGHLKLGGGRIFQSSFNRPNLTYRVVPKRKSFERLLAEVRSRPDQSVVVYCFSRSGTEKVAKDLVANGVKAAAYHAGLPAHVRSRVQERFIHDQVSVIVATIAFGMGIDKPDVRLVAHLDLPKSVEGYYQETGRAGRDGLPSDCLLFYSAGDRMKHEYFIRGMEDPEERERVRVQLREMMRYAELNSCRRKFLLGYFGETWSEPTCGACDVCVPRVESVPTRETPVGFDAELFEKLRAHRRRLAEASHVPPYVIFGDKTLQEMSRAFPQSPESLANISGVGSRKLSRYGFGFLEIIRAYAQANGLAERPSSESVVRHRKPSVRSVSGTILETVRLFEKRFSLERIALMRKVSVGTVVNHLEQALERGKPIDVSHVTDPSPERRERIGAAFRQTGNDMLAPARALLGDGFSYDEIRVARLILRADAVVASSDRTGVSSEE